MSWLAWLSIWAISLAFTGTVVGLIFLLNFWALPLVFGVVIIGVGLAVCE